ncbi:MAG: hypothetical protein NVS1B4_08840 [Gemmatimonadaceae bacterium]
MRQFVRDGAKDRPGTYRMVASDGEVLYVGKSKRLRSRLLSYFRCAYPVDKGARILREAASITWTYEPSEFAALLAELRLIKQFRPRFNVAMKRDARHLAFIKLTRGPAAKLLVVRGPSSDDAAMYYGPFQGARRVGDAVRELNDALGLRDCALDRTMVFADQRELFRTPSRTPGCIRYEIGKCLGPCVAACTEAEYTRQVALARAFLDGVDDGPIDAIARDMDLASEELRYERAAILRDKLRRLESLKEQFSRLRFAVETLSFVYTVPGADGDDRHYVIRRGTVRAECAVDQVRDRDVRLRSLVDDVFATHERSGGSIPAHEIDELLLLSSWFRRFPMELERTDPAVARRSARSA